MNNRIPSYAMFSPEGDAAVHGVVVACRAARSLDGGRDEYEEFVTMALVKLAKSHKDFAEATDTAVRECVFAALDKE